MTPYERNALALLAALVGLQVARSGDQQRKALALGRAALDDTLAALEADEVDSSATSD